MDQELETQANAAAEAMKDLNDELVVCTQERKREEKEKNKSVDLNIVDLEILPKAPKDEKSP